MKRRTMLRLSASAFAVGSAYSSSSFAATWPERGVKIILPFPPGGTSDVVARLLAEKLSISLSHPVLVESKAGASGIIASDFVAKSKDGHTFLLASAAHTSNLSHYPKLPYDTVKDFVGIAQVVPPGPMVLAVHSGVPAQTLQEFIEYAKKNPGTVSYDSAGIGNTLHLAGEMLAQMANIKLLHVPYRGAAPALTDLASGQINMMFNSLLAVAPYVKEGRIKLIAQTGLKRSNAMPDLPTIHEIGLQGFEVTGWFGLMAPLGVPAETVQRLNVEVNRIMALPELREKLAQLGTSEVPNQTAQEFVKFLDSETKRYAKVIRTAGLSLSTPTQ